MQGRRAEADRKHSEGTQRLHQAEHGLSPTPGREAEAVRKAETEEEEKEMLAHLNEQDLGMEEDFELPEFDD